MLDVIVVAAVAGVIGLMVALLVGLYRLQQEERREKDLGRLRRSQTYDDPSPSGHKTGTMWGDDA